MSREIRKVKRGWKHPEGFGLYNFDSYADHLKDFKENPEDWDGVGPAMGDYMPDPGEDFQYQIYETVSEGSPDSPRFDTLEGMKGYLINHRGHSEKAAGAFIECGWAPSMMYVEGVGMKVNIDTYDFQETKND